VTLADGVRRQEERLLNCVHCGFCLPACPTYVRLGDEADSPRGRLHLMRAVVEGRLDPAAEAFQLHLDRCLGCRACETVCPSGVEYGILLEQAREQAVAARPPGIAARLLPAVFASPLLRFPVLLAARLLRWSGLPLLLARRLPEGGLAGTVRLGMAMLAASGPPAFPGGKASAPSPPPVGKAPPPQGGVKVAVLDGCVQAGLFARVNGATRRVLRANGVEVVAVPGQGCCGALHAHSGALERARELARRNIAAFQAAGVEAVAVNAAGCGAAMRDYVHLLEEDPEWAGRGAAFSRGVRDISQLLVAGPLRQGAPVEATVAYDAPCHLLHAQRVSEPPLQLLRSIPGVELRPLAGWEECCGGAGIYGITHPELGGRIGGDKVQAVRNSGARWVATGNPGCMMQIGAGLLLEGVDAQVVHPVELLDESYRRAGVYRRGGG